MKPLTELIDEGWQQLAEAAKNEDWSATRRAFTYMEKLQEINEESTKSLQKQFPEIATVGPTGNGPAEDDFKWLSQIVGTRRSTTRPKELRIESDRIPISMNNQIVVATANWILKQGKPIPRMKNFTHPTNSGFAKSAKTKQLDDGSYIEIGDSQDTLIQKAKRLLTVCGFADLKLEVLLEDGAVRTS